jgi:hypothetical protein
VAAVWTIRLLLSAIAVSGAAGPESSAMSEAEIRNRMIHDSIMEFPDRCPCPYSLAADRKPCGRRSAYSKTNGASPICFEKDVTPDMIKRFRERGY